MFRKTKKATNLEWEDAIDVKDHIEEILSVLSNDFNYVEIDRVFCFRTEGSTSRSYARIWSMPKIFQRALNIKPAYVIEVLAKYFDKLNRDEQKKVLIHELLHIPKNFSGTLLPHRTKSRHLGTEVNRLYKVYKSITSD